VNRLAIVAAVLLVASVVSPLAAASGGAAASNGLTTAQVAEQNQTDDTPALEELRAGGEKPANAPPSVRASGTYSEYALKSLPTGLWVDEENPSSWRYLESGTDVKRDTVQLWSKRGYGASSKDVTVRVAHYQTRERTRNNETERVATNVTTYSTTATLGGGYDFVDVALRSHYQSSYNTVVCVDDGGNCLTNPNGLRWHFNHQTSAAMQATSVDSEGDKIAWGLGFVLLPFLGSSLSFLYGARKAIEAAKSKPYIPWWVGIVAVIATPIVLFGFWDQIVATSVRAPWALSLLGGALTGLVAAIWFGANRQRSMFFRLRPQDYVDVPPEEGGNEAVADGGETEEAQPGRASSALVADLIPANMVHGKNGERYHVSKGFWNWIARVRGATAALEADEEGGELQTRVEVDRGPYEELYFLDPEADDEEVLDYEREGHDWGLPKILWKDEDGWHLNVNLLASGGFVFGISSLLGEVLLASAEIGLLIAGLVVGVRHFATPSDGTLKARLANIHYQRALPTVITNAHEISEASSVTELFDKYTESEMDRRVDQQELEDRRDRTQMGQLTDRYLGADGREERDEEPSENGTEASADD
jgi:hypothetical protein